MGTALKINLIWNRFRHHSGHSGYDQISRFLGNGISILNIQESTASWIPWKIAKLLIASSGLVRVGYTVRSFYAEEIIMHNILTKNNQIYHFIYGENSYRYSGILNKCRGNKIISTYHFPPNLLDKTIPNKKYLKRLSAIIVVGSNQVSYFTHIVGEEKVFLVPHGIDTDFFHPPEIKTNNGTCLFVGMHLRDYKMMKETITMISGRDKDIKFVVISDKERFGYFIDLPNVLLKSEITEMELLEFYRTSDLLVLPLIDCTANNSILEALACGLPVITTDVGAIRDYVDEDCAVLVPPKDTNRLADEIQRLLQNDSLRAAMTLNCRRKALHFDWRQISKQMIKVYQQVFCQ